MVPRALGSYQLVEVVDSSADDLEACTSWPGPEDAGSDAGSSDAGSEGLRIISQPSVTATCAKPYRYSEAGAPDVQGRGPYAFRVSAGGPRGTPRGLRVDAATGEFHWTPEWRDVGPNELELLVTGPDGTAVQAFEVMVDCPERANLGVGCGCLAGAAYTSILLLGLAAIMLRRRAG